MLFAELETQPLPTPPPAPKPIAAHELIQRFAEQEADDTDASASETTLSPEVAAPDPEPAIIAALHDMLADSDCAFHPESFLYQDFSVRCRMQRLGRVPLDLAQFRKRFALAKGGIFDPADDKWRDLLSAADRLPDDMLAPFVQIARAAIEGSPCPDDDALGRAYGTRSPGRIRRLVDYMEKQGAIVVRSDFGGRRSIGIPELGLSTEAE